MRFAFALFLVSVATRNLEDSYIIKLKGYNRTPIQAHLNQVRALFKGRSGNNEIRKVYTSIGNMYSARFTRQVREQVSSMADVEYITKDTLFSVNKVQPNSTWGLSRISKFEKLKPSDPSYTYDYTLEGTGTTVYVLDTGIMVDHPEFEGRARIGAHFAGKNDADEHGHGTHCAGIVASKTYGVAKQAKLVAVRVLDADGAGSTSEIVSGLDWVMGDAGQNKGIVVNLSLGGPKNVAMDDAVAAVAQRGILVVVAAGNANEDACNTSPARSPHVITVGATNIHDSKADISNYGKCVDIFAPGEDIMSTTHDGQAAKDTGTSMAAPFVSGLAAYYMSQKFEESDAIRAKILRQASPGLLTKLDSDSPNLLINNHL